MENASKALIIAGAILLAILLISLGIIIFSQAQDTVDNSGMTQAEVQTFNGQLVKYEGEQKGTVVKTMIQEVLAINNNGSGYTITVTVDGGAMSTTNPTKDITNADTYDVKLGYDTTGTGRVTTITVTTIP